ncbi:DUF1543 domain-containing protein [Ancylomarina sp. 16SWW S1-10-2]|uniref:DUF1543 domain-containing protein n=1 Tax=Ancylomarina sp. 16SWW S1-10-2 TaxID=2499681 RepID=UPI0012ADAD9D|nr:DUF1543 domain-containing protein [Ancylomarina sp. 16SWW S1-10-2]MRT93583.1 DUF1543 domain-containing protein [Ancylomarina sp. 16SWW S1-10-2]
MKNPNLYAVLLGGKIRENNLMEDHHLVFVVAENEKEARKLSKTKWDAVEIHVDGTQKISSVDGYQINLEKTNKEDDDSLVNPKYSA